MSTRPDDEFDRTAPGRSGEPPSRPDDTLHSGASAEDDATLGPSERPTPGAVDPTGPTIVRPPTGATRNPAVPPREVPAPPTTPATRRESSSPPARVAVTPKASVQAEPTPAGPLVFGGRFEVVSVLGEGGMGKVYSVRDRQIEGRAVALKVLLPKFSRNEKFRSLFFQEIRAAQNFVSEHVVQVRDCGQMDDGRLFVTMDLVEGESLRDLLGREASLRPRHALEIARQTLLALQSGHERGFVHRDIKPSNVMLTTRVPKTDENPYGVGARVLDFGIAGLVAELDEGKVAGTPLYMSPEQIQGQRLDARSDLFAVGVVLYECLSGRRPFEGKTLEEITTSVIETDLSPRIAEMKELSAPIRKILEKALQKNRDQRFQSATDFIKAIETSSAYKLPSAVPGWVVGALVVAVLAAAAEGYVLWSGVDRSADLQRQVNDSQTAITNARTQHADALAQKDKEIAAQRTRADDAESELARKREELAGLSIAKGDEDTSFESRLLALQGEINRLDTQFKQAERARQELADAKAAADLAIQRLEGEKSAANERATKAENALRDAQARFHPAARKANTFEDILSLLERGGGSQAQVLYEQMIGERVFERAAQPGTDLVDELIGAAVALERFDASRTQATGPDIRALLEASRRLGQAKRLRESIEVTAKDWIAHEIEEGAPNPRLQRLDAFLTRYGERVKPEVDALGDYHASDWRRVTEAGLEQGPREALEHLELFTCEHLAELTRSVAAHCEAKLAPGGKLDTRALAPAAFLDEWVAHLENRPAELDQAESTLLAFSYARRWYDSDEANDAQINLAKLPAPAVAAASHDWRAVLRLQIELAQPDSGYPIKAGRKLVYRMQNDSPLRWRVQELARGAQLVAGGPWDLTQTNFKSDALPIGAPEVLRLVRRRGMYLVEGASDPLLDLKIAGDAVWVAPFPALFDQLPPPQLGVSQVVMQEHRERLVANVGPCLVFKRGAVLRWFSPEFGMVLEELEGQAVRTELVFATPLR